MLPARLGTALAGASIAVGALLSACGGGSRSGPGDGGDGRLRVVASVPVLADVARLIGGSGADVTLLAGDGDAHGLELTSAQADAVEDAAVVVYLGGGFQPAVEAAVSRRRPEGVIDALALVGPAGGTEGGDKDLVNPHVWLDLGRLDAIVEAVAEAMAEQSSPGPPARAIAARAKALRAEVTNLDRKFSTGLANCKRRTIVTAHAAFGYLVDRYDLTERSLAGLSPEAEPDPASLAELADVIRAEGVTTVFEEPGAESDVARTLAAEAGVTTAVLDPLERPSKLGFISAMGTNLDALRVALDCA